MFVGAETVWKLKKAVRLTAETFGREQAPLVFGYIFAAHQLGAGVMAFGAGISRDTLASYLPAFFVAGMLCVIAALSLGLLRNRRTPVVMMPQTA